MRQDFNKDMRSLDAIFDFLDEFTARERLDADESYALALAVEEFFSNIVKYGKGTAGRVGIEAAKDGSTVTVKLEEETPVPFDVTKVPSPRLPDHPLSHGPGGLGIHLARAMLDGLEYDYQAGMSKITLIKQVRASDV
jgi:anti-sigma regulatory factor (Ser/Thr protein kinase)